MSRLFPTTQCSDRDKPPSSHNIHPSDKILRLSISPKQCYADRNENDEITFPDVRFQSSSDQHDLMLDNIACMLNQEVKAYSCEDYMYGKNIRVKFSHRRNGAKNSKTVNESCREQICEWCYRVVNFFKLDREIVYITMSYLDRFLATFVVDRYTYKVAATTALLLVLKVYHPRKVILSDVITELSRGEFDSKDIEEMEIVLLRTLSWRINPPTAYCFVKHFMMLNPYASRPIQEFDVDGIESHAIFFVELSVFDYFLITSKQSEIAFAAILNAMEGLGLWTTPNQRRKKVANRASVSKYISRLCMTLDINHDDKAIENVRERLWDLYLSSEEHHVKNINHNEKQRVKPKRMAERRKKNRLVASNRFSPKSVSH